MIDLDRLFTLADVARAGRRLAAADIAFLRDDVPGALPNFPMTNLPKSVRHPAGFTIAGAPVRTFTACALLVAGRKAFGAEYQGAPFYERAESRLALTIMSAHFHGAAPKGAFCCKQCTLALLTVYDANAIRQLDGRALAKDLRRMIEAREWRYATPPNAKMMAWAMG